MTTYDDRLFLEGDPFLGGQNARKIYAEMGVVDAQRQHRGAYNLMRGK